MKTALWAAFILVGVSGFEPEASWTRTKRDTKLRHTPIAQIVLNKHRLALFQHSYYTIE